MELGKRNREHRNPCLTMHQPWASLLVHGIKRVEGRSWPAPLRGRLWIHAAGKVPDAATIKAMESFYKEIYALNGITDLNFPEEYPVSRLVGCVEVVGCVRNDELASWHAVPEGVRLEALTDMCWLCEDPKILLNPLQMRGYKGVYDLGMKISENALRYLVPAQGPIQIKFPLPNQRDPFSLRPGSLYVNISAGSKSEIKKSSSMVAAIAGAWAAATQFSRKDESSHARTLCMSGVKEPVMMDRLKSTSVEVKRRPTNNLDTKSYRRVLAARNKERNGLFQYEGNNSNSHHVTRTSLDGCPRGPSKIFAAAIKEVTSGANFHVH